MLLILKTSWQENFLSRQYLLTSHPMFFQVHRIFQTCGQYFRQQQVVCSHVCTSVGTLCLNVCMSLCYLSVSHVCLYTKSCFPSTQNIPDVWPILPIVAGSMSVCLHVGRSLCLYVCFFYVCLYTKLCFPSAQKISDV